MLNRLMDDFLKFIKVLAVLVVILGIGAVVGWFGTRGPTATPRNSTPSAQTAERNAPASPRSPQPNPKSAVAPLPELVSSASSSTVITNWEDRLDEILADEKPESEKAKQLLEMFPRLPEDGQVEVAQHLSNLVEDDHYAALGGFLTNSALSEDVLDVLLSDLLNRPNSLKLPALLGVARDPKNPKAGEAKDLLELYLEEDYGTDWKKWQQKTEEWLKENAD